MKSQLDLQLACRPSPLSHLHFSWYLLLFALLWAIASSVVFSSGTLHALNEIRPIPFDFPKSADHWNIRGDQDALQICGKAICLNSDTGNDTRAVLFIPVPHKIWSGVDQLVFEAHVTDTLHILTNAKKTTSPGFVVARALSSEGKGVRNLGSVIELNNHQKSIFHRRISSLHPQTSNLQLVVSLRHAGTVKIDDIRFYAVKLSWQYRLLRALIMAGWIVMLLFLALRLLSRFTQTAKIIGAIGFTILLAVGASQYASILRNPLTRLSGEFWNTHVAGIFLLSHDASLAMLHVIFHLALTIYLGKLSQPGNFSYKQNIAVNLSIAIGVECAQMGIPARSADVYDLAAATVGTLSGLALLSAIQTIKKCRQTCSDN